MKRIILLLCFLVIEKALIAQKPPVDFTTCKNWPFVNGALISDNGQFVMFTIENEPLGNHTLVIKSSDGKWEKKITGASSAKFVNRSKCVSFRRSNGTTSVLNLGNHKRQPMPTQTNTSKVIDNSIQVYRADLMPNRIIICNPFTKQKDSIDNIDDYILTARHDGIVFQTRADNKASLLWYNLNNKIRETIWTGTTAQQCLLNHDNSSSGYVLFKVTETAEPINDKLSNVDIWTYKDASDPEPFSQDKNPLEYNYAVNSSNHHIIQLTYVHEILMSSIGDFALIQYNLSNNPFEASWNDKARAAYYWVSVKDGTRKLIIKQTSGDLILAMQSPDGKYVILGDESTMHYYSYNVESGSIIDLLKDEQIYKTTIDMGFRYLPFIFSWTNDSSFIVEDDYDLWQIDITGGKTPINLTGGYGNTNQIIFRLLQMPYNDRFKIFNDFDGCLLNTFDKRDKSWGFYKLNNAYGKIPTKLNMGQYYYGGDGAYITRAKNAKRYIVMRETVSESRNLFITKDFKKFDRLSDVSPEKGYNWMNTELIKWQAYNGRTCEGILYKPENFDALKKYPVVVIVYNQFSDKKNKFITIDDSEFGGTNFLSVAWLVSNGYLVFIPDIIHRKQGERLKDSYDMVVSGVEYIKSLPYVNKGRIGLEGASWGGEQVNYIITHTNIFAAAFTGAGYSERISDYGFLDQYKQWPNSMANEMNLLGNFIEVPETYIKEAALFSANKVSTPLLIKHNKGDRAVPFYQGFQFFTILRRLGKKVWMLQYESGDHGVQDGKDKEDMYQRIGQFFDHYLKDQPAPFWMTEGIAPDRKQIDSGLDLDLRLGASL